SPRTAGPVRQLVLCPHVGPTRSHSLPHWSMRRRSSHHRVPPPAPTARPATARAAAAPMRAASVAAVDRLGGVMARSPWVFVQILDRKSTRLNSSHDQISYAVFCLKKKTDSASTNLHSDDTPGRFM